MGARASQGRPPLYSSDECAANWSGKWRFKRTAHTSQRAVWLRRTEADSRGRLRDITGKFTGRTERYVPLVHKPTRPASEIPVLRATDSSRR